MCPNKATHPEKHNTLSKNHHLTMGCCMIPAYSFKCYLCGPIRVDQDYPADQCEKDQRIENCTGEDYTCMKLHKETTDGIEQETRACIEKSFCEGMKKACSDDEKVKEAKIKSCQAACCVSTGDTPCNSATTASSSVMIMMMVAALCSLKLF